MSNQKQRRAALYIRVSTREQANKGTSTKAQEIELKRYAEDQNIKITDTYIDDGYSGSNLDRPRFQDMLNDAKSGLFDTILIWKYDRFSRNLIDQEISILQLKKLNVSVNSITEDGDTLIRQIRGAVNQDELKKTIQRSKLVKEMRAKQGYHLAASPFGYSFDQNHDLKQNEDAPTVLKIYNECSGKEKLNMSQIAKKHNVTRFIVSNILKNPIYRGLITYKKTEYKGRHQPIINPPF